MNPEEKLPVRLTYVAGWALTALFALAHLLILASLVAFGLRAGGWVLPPLAVAWYGLFALGSIPLLVRARRSESAHWLFLIPFALTLALVGAFGVSADVGRAVYGPYNPGDRYRNLGPASGRRGTDAGLPGGSVSVAVPPAGWTPDSGRTDSDQSRRVGEPHLLGVAQPRNSDPFPFCCALRPGSLGAERGALGAGEFS